MTKHEIKNAHVVVIVDSDENTSVKNMSITIRDAKGSLLLIQTGSTHGRMITNIVPTGWD